MPSGTTGTVETVQTDTYTTSYTRPYLPPSDPNRIYRIVGFWEYSKALQNLDELAAMATPDEMYAIETIVKLEPEFTVFTNLSRRLEMGRSTLAEPIGAGDDGARKGFKWVTALARVEVGAMLAAFTNHPQPFAAVAGKGYDKAEYKEMLLDGAKMHFWSLTNDPGFTTIMRRFTPNGTTLTYLRRLNLASALVHALAFTSGQEFNPAQRQEVLVYVSKLGQSRQSIRERIEAYLSQVAASTKKTGTKTENKLLEACYNGVCQQFGDAQGGGNK